MSIDLKDLKESNEFLNLILENVGAAVLVADENFQIHEFNGAFVSLFDSAGIASATTSFGEASGCVNAVRENKACGETSQCGACVLRHSLIQTVIADAPVDHKPLNRIFYVKGQAVQKYMRFTTRRIIYRGRTMILVIIYDVSDIEIQKQELERKQTLIDQDLKAAAAIQRSLLPLDGTGFGRLRAAWKFSPCDRIGGDIFNLHRVDQRQVGLYMLDVCGHGVPAALVSVAASQFLLSGRGLLGSGCELGSPETVLSHLDEAFPFERFETYFSIVCMTIDIERGLLTYGSAGHPPPILLRAGGGMEILDHRGPVIGFGSGKPFGQQERRLAPGDKIILYTDGVTENRGRSGQAFGKERFYRALEKASRRPVGELVEIVYGEMKRFLGGVRPDDDISLLGVTYAEGEGDPSAPALS
jgi:sigma-B regulation protein RsbU (phosphoserine phosphatase)